MGWMGAKGWTVEDVITGIAYLDPSLLQWMKKAFPQTITVSHTTRLRSHADTLILPNKTNRV